MNSLLAMGQLCFDSFCLHELGMVPAVVQRTLEAWLHEDCGHGDLTVKGLGSLLNETSTAQIVAKQDCVVAGLPLALAVEAMLATHLGGRRPEDGALHRPPRALREGLAAAFQCTKERYADALTVLEGTEEYWSAHAADEPFGARLDAHATIWTGSSLCVPPAAGGAGAAAKAGPGDLHRAGQQGATPHALPPQSRVQSHRIARRCRRRPRA